jgi:hypothetical protein
LAIVQISRITQRKGLQTDLPEYLAGAEFGWSVDERRLFIGNGTLAEGAPTVGNTEILTQYSDIFEIVPAYTYKGAAAGYIAQTSEDGSPVKVTLQNWMDQWASVLDFGVSPENSASENTAALNWALNQIYCVQTNVEIRRSLFFPAGIYKIDDSIKIPPYATLYGEGPDNSILQLQLDSVADYVIQTTDAEQNTGVNIGVPAPQSITISNMCFESLATTDVALIDQATDCMFTDVIFKGPLSESAILNNQDADDISCVRFNSAGSVPVTNIQFNRCQFIGTTYGINTNLFESSTPYDQYVVGVTVSQSKFDTLYQGVVIGDNTPPVTSNQAPGGFRIIGNFFDSVYAEGILIDNSELNVSAQNIFYDVGNWFDTAPHTSIVSFKSANNLSTGDMFERNDTDAETITRIFLNDQPSIAFTNGSQLSMGNYTRLTGIHDNVQDNQSSPQELVTVNATYVSAFSINYSILRDTASRVGTITVSTNVGGSALNYSDDFVQNQDTGVTLTITQVGSTVSLNYTSLSTGQSGIINFSINYLV